MVDPLGVLLVLLRSRRPGWVRLESGLGWGQRFGATGVRVDCDRSHGAWALSLRLCGGGAQLLAAWELECATLLDAADAIEELLGVVERVGAALAAGGAP